MNWIGSLVWLCRLRLLKISGWAAAGGVVSDHSQVSTTSHTTNNCVLRLEGDLPAACTPLHTDLHCILTWTGSRTVLPELSSISLRTTRYQRLSAPISAAASACYEGRAYDLRFLCCSQYLLCCLGIKPTSHTKPRASHSFSGS